MANRNVNESVVERRLKPIYEWLDNGNNKKAVQEADKVLRKQPNLQCAIVLKALALLRLGKSEESSNLVNSVVAEGTSDDASLQALTIYFREIQEPEMICTIYEKASQLDPNNEEIMSHLFMAHVRVGDYKKQRQTAMLLYKCKPKNPYYFWAVMSIVMQAQETKDRTERNVSLQLAERMITNFFNENKIESEAEVLTYLYILEIQEKYGEALQLLNSFLVKMIQQQPPNFIPLKKALYCFRLHQYQEAVSIYKYLITLEPDNWQHYVNLIDSAICAFKCQSDENNENELDPLTEVSQFLKNERDKANFASDRSPQLSFLQFCVRLIEEGLQQKLPDLCGDFTDLLFDYISKFGSKMCCFSDIINFLPFVPVADASNLLSRVHELIQFSDDGTPLSVENIYRHQIYLQLSRSLIVGETETSLEKDLEFADNLVSIYHQTSALVENMTPTDIRPNDSYLLLAAHVYYSIIMKLVKDNYMSLLSGNHIEAPPREVSSLRPMELLTKMCAFLETGADASKANFQIKLILVKIYNLVGAIDASYSVCEQLDLKQIQLDTLGYICSNQLSDYGNFSAALTVYMSTLRFFVANFKDTTEPLIMSYKFGSLIRIPEFVAFRHRLNKSLQFLSTGVERVIVDLTFRVNSRSEIEVFASDLKAPELLSDWDELRDNRELFIMNSWEPYNRRLTPTHVQASYEDEKVMLRVRDTVVRVVHLALQCRGFSSKDSTNKSSEMSSNSSAVGQLTNGEINGHAESPLVRFKEFVEKLRIYTSDCDIYKKRIPLEYPLAGPDVPRIYLYARGNYLAVLLKHADAFAVFHEDTDFALSDRKNTFSSYAEIFKGLKEEWRQCIDFHLNKLDLLSVSVTDAVPNINNHVILLVSHLLQTVSLSLIFVEGLSNTLQPLKINAKKGKKKKTSKSNLLKMQTESFLSYNEYISFLSSELDIFSQKLNQRLKMSQSQPSSDAVADVSDQLNRMEVTSANKKFSSGICPEDNNNRSSSSTDKLSNEIAPKVPTSDSAEEAVLKNTVSAIPILESISEVDKAKLRIEQSLEKNIENFIYLLRCKIDFLNELKI